MMWKTSAWAFSFAASWLLYLPDERMLHFGRGGFGLVKVIGKGFVLMLEGCRSA